ncbi:unnamed protein product [Cylindrotheca closterium]|uniref:Uncharacterized protein n=1 Tax=Cylindrotheca closterium TaxID=2856 RepID=A0AAD2CE17_9STRA|nr:unnamed protein product [Cylindrotheca closterium]
MAEDSCNIWGETILALQSDELTPTKMCAWTIAFVVAITFVTSSLTGNYSQVDKLWSVIPFVYCWIVVTDKRTLLMAIIATLWGVRLTWNFNRRGGYKWPIWDGDEDYRWKLLQDGALLEILKNKVAWVAFNLLFISFYQNVLLFLIVAPSLVAHIVATGCGQAVPLNGYDYLATALIPLFIAIEAIADNQQYNFQTEKYRRKNAGETLTGEYADGFKSSGFFAIVRKPNYAAEQAIWIAFYLYSIGAVNGERFVNWSSSGWTLLCVLFQGSGWLIEQITLGKYPKYGEYMEQVPRYIPNPMELLGLGASKTKTP